MDKWTLLKELLQEKKFATYGMMNNIKDAIEAREDDKDLSNLVSEGHRLQCMLEAYLDIEDSMTTLDKSHGNIIIV